MEQIRATRPHPFRNYCRFHALGRDAKIVFNYDVVTELLPGVPETARLGFKVFGDRKTKPYTLYFQPVRLGVHEAKAKRLASSGTFKAWRQNKGVDVVMQARQLWEEYGVPSDGRAYRVKMLPEKGMIQVVISGGKPLRRNK